MKSKNETWATKLLAGTRNQEPGRETSKRQIEPRPRRGQLEALSSKTRVLLASIYGWRVEEHRFDTRMLVLNCANTRDGDDDCIVLF